MGKLNTEGLTTRADSCDRLDAVFQDNFKLATNTLKYDFKNSYSTCAISWVFRVLK
jgi:hypothetical protein